MNKRHLQAARSLRSVQSRADALVSPLSLFVTASVDVARQGCNVRFSGART